MDKNLLVQIVVDIGDDKVRCGTAYPVAPGRVITAAHVIGDAKSGSIKASWYHQPTGQRGWKSCEAILWNGRPDFDVAVLEVDGPEAVKSRFGILADSKPKTDARWESEGFPLVGRCGDDLRPIPMKGALYSMGGQTTLFQLDVDDPPASQHGWQGASGSPVFVDGAIIGVVVTCPNDFNNGRLEAVPAFRLLQDDGFKKAVELTADEQRKLLVEAAVQVLGASEKSLQALAGEIGVLELRHGATGARAIIDKLLGIQSPPGILTAMLRAINNLDKRQSKDAADIIEQAGYYIIPAALADAHVKQLTIVVQAQSGNFEFQAKTKMFVEIGMARINGRMAMFQRVSNSNDMAVGRLCLPNPPEAGMDESGDRFVDAFVAHLSGIIPQGLLSEKLPENIRAINAVIDSQFDVERWQYYYVFEYSKNEAERRRSTLLSERLRKKFPKIAFIVLDCDEISEEELHTVPKMIHFLCRAAGIEYKPHGTP